MTSKSTPPDNARLDRIVAEARRNREQRNATYREQALRIYPWICGRCARDAEAGNEGEEGNRPKHEPYVGACQATRPVPVDFAGDRRVSRGYGRNARPPLLGG